MFVLSGLPRGRNARYAKTVLGMQCCQRQVQQVVQLVFGFNKVSLGAICAAVSVAVSFELCCGTMKQ
jgi:hypothetical protein